MRYGYKYKLTAAQHRDIRAKYKDTRSLRRGDPDKHTYDSLCAEYGISRDTLWKILNNYHVHYAPLDGEDAT